ncbi:MAG: TolC family protein [Thermodesulfovibrio sp.]|uniref:TolC family protein n=1 Tax=unclassified Thermodesulfovibrio TaxID=2645936 RepID=UPI00083AC6BF|nr:MULTISPECIES: TolC family protein [unclassified Thermodesulfovibrio]MDI1472197.1 TolC family protein [Thermodesulfovibrio sp. 1176]MDI6714060.1 TolC family protein [Thermodesulfovibrio sp.]ODA43865.1 Outer membrane component of tripartite multidrug resistance system [Thermodesulfovibrio sp. N1]
MRTCLFLIFFLFILQSKALSIDSSELNQPIYSLQDCIEIALKKNPEILASKQQVEKSYFKIGEAKSGYLPEIELSLGYQRSYQEAQKLQEYSKNYSGQIVLTQTLFDFGRTSLKVDIQKILFDSSIWQDKDTKINTVYTVKEAYFNLLKAKKQRKTAQEVLKQAQRHLDLAKGFYEVGLKPKIEVTKAEVELSNAKLAVISAEKLVRQALLNLKIAMGDVYMPDFDIKEEDYALRKLDENDAIKVALEKNPQLQSVKFNRQASEISEDLVKKEYFPTLTGTGRYGYSGEDFPLNRGWSLLFQINFPLFSGWSTTYKLKQAKADVAYYSYKEESIKQQITSQIKNLFVQLKEASQRIETLKEALRQAKENLDLAMARYEVGIGSSIEVVDAIVLYEQINTQYWQAIYDYNVTYASIEKIVGMEK